MIKEIDWKRLKQCLSAETYSWTILVEDDEWGDGCTTLRKETCALKPNRRQRIQFAWRELRYQMDNIRRKRNMRGK